MARATATKSSTTFRNAFTGQAKAPTDRELAAALGATKALWDQLLAELAAEHNLAPEWNSYSIKAGWSLRLQREKRNIVYFAPSQGGFMASFALGDKAMKAARGSGLPKRVVKTLDEAKKYAEGTAVRIEVHGQKDIEVVQKLARAKVEN